jgi:hypothetical protein
MVPPSNTDESMPTRLPGAPSTIRGQSRITGIEGGPSNDFALSDAGPTSWYPRRGGRTALDRRAMGSPSFLYFRKHNPETARSSLSLAVLLPLEPAPQKPTLLLGLMRFLCDLLGWGRLLLRGGGLRILIFQRLWVIESLVLLEFRSRRES